ncbi:unnamed protein product [Larinioides sclopetarius]|uniref:Cysteine-rich secretory protein domain-containing protein n=1 Tax=Larinioides sclopetarius TaxID=280406 RepID=A0AAV2BCI0_9ARAC
MTKLPRMPSGGQKLASCSSTTMPLDAGQTMVWHSTHKVGCGFNYCPENNITKHAYFSYVCNYCPIGNHPERFDRPYTNGTACSECDGHCRGNKLCKNGCPYADFWTNCNELNSTWHNWLCDDETTDRYQACRSTCRCEGKIR